jgi:hypothetical protein
VLYNSSLRIFLNNDVEIQSYQSLRNLFLILFTACLPWMASAYKGPIDKPQAQSASHIHIQAAKNAVIVHFRMDAPGVAGITLKDARGRCILLYAGYYPNRVYIPMCGKVARSVPAHCYLKSP